MNDERDLESSGGIPSQDQVPDRLLDTVMSVLASELARSNGYPAEFSSKSLTRLQQRQAEYIEDLGIYAIRIARREHLDEVSATHVDQAVSRLTEPVQNRRAITMQTVGGAMLGVGGGQLFAVLSAEHPSTLAYVLVVVGLVLGVVLVMLGFRRR